MYEHFTAAGAPAELDAYGRFMSDSHKLLGSWEGLRIWTPRLEAFLARIGMLSAALHPEYMPMRLPEASGYTAVCEKSVSSTHDGFDPLT